MARERTIGQTTGRVSGGVDLDGATEEALKEETMEEIRGPRLPAMRGRGTAVNPPNRFESLAFEPDLDALDWEERQSLAERRVPTQCYLDDSKEALARNDSPDVPFLYSVNPYRGCEHGCSYCYARPTHEFLGMSCGLDFESKIVVKRDAARLLAKKFRSPHWEPQVVALSGNTDCYQPVEKHFGITRQLLEVFLDFGNPVGIITKSALVLRDLDLLRRLAEKSLVQVTLSVTSLDPALARAMEPRAATPAKRLEAIQRLSEAGIPTTVNVAPIVPGLNDHEIPAILAACAERGALGAAYIMLRLPHGVKELFLDWLETHFPERRKKVIRAIQEVRGGGLTDSRFGSRMSGEGVRAEAIERLFHIHRERVGLGTKAVALSTAHFRREGSAQQQLTLE